MRMDCCGCRFWGNKHDERGRRAVRLCALKDIYTTGGDSCALDDIKAMARSAAAK